MLLLLTLACNACGPTPTPSETTGAHGEPLFAAIEALEGGELAAVVQACRQLEAPQADAKTQESVDQLHGALGYCQVAEDSWEAADALVEVALACASCHRSASAGPTLENLTLLARSAPLHAADADRLWAATLSADSAAVSAAQDALMTSWSALDEGLPQLLSGAPDSGAATPMLATAAGACAPCHKGGAQALR